MTNLLMETMDAIKESGHEVTDITFIGSETGEHACTWAEFQTLADKEYDSGYGAQEVASDLVIRFSDTKHMWRNEYDGSEDWSYDGTPGPEFDGTPQPITNLIGGMWETIAGLNAEVAS